MSRTRAYRLGLGLVAFAVLGGTILVAHAAAAHPSGAPSPAGYVPGAPLLPRPIGVPAITPHPALAHGAGPAFTQADVVQWVVTHRLADAVPGSPAAAVVSVEFLTSQQVSVRLHGESTGMPDSALLCYVRVAGTFASYSPLGGAPLIYHAGYIAFDAHTGNIIMDNVG